MGLPTTTIGAYPKPADAPAPMWTELGARRRGAPTEVYDRILDRLTPAARATLDRMTADAVRAQAAAGIDIPTDGEIRREHYVYYHCRHLRGVDFADLTLNVMREGSWTARVPTVRGAVTAGAPFLAADWRVAQAATERPVKITVPGPLTICDSLADAHYGDRAALARALADALNVEIRRLADAGCRWIQVDEPLFARQIDAALEFGVADLERCFHSVDKRVRRAVHVCCGYPARLDDPAPAKADAGAYAALAGALDAAAVDAVSIEDAHHRNDLRLLEAFARTTVILGVVDIASSVVEPVEAIRARLMAALAHIDRDRLIAAPDCGLALLPERLAVAKLRNLAEAAHGV